MCLKSSIQAYSFSFGFGFGYGPKCNHSFGAVSVSAESENVVPAAVSVTAVTGKSGFGRSLSRTQFQPSLTIGCNGAWQESSCVTLW